MKLNIDQIIDGNSYRYSRTIGGKTISGVAVALQVYEDHGWRILVHDRKNHRTPTLRLKHILGPARVR
jgi:hypothetical protein